MYLIKLIFLLLIFVASSRIGYILASRYKDRVNDLQEIQSALSMLKTKMRYTYETLPDIFEEIMKTTNTSVANIFRIAIEEMNNNMNAGTAWRKAVTNGQTSFIDEDKIILIRLEKMLGKTDLDGQIGELESIKNLLDMQIKKAEQEKLKNEKLYKTLGNVVGVTIVILLI